MQKLEISQPTVSQNSMIYTRKIIKQNISVRKVNITKFHSR